MSPSADILNWATIDCGHPVTVFPDLKVDIDNSFAPASELSAKILARLDVKAVRILNEAEANVFVGFG